MNLLKKFEVLKQKFLFQNMFRNLTIAQNNTSRRAKVD